MWCPMIVSNPTGKSPSQVVQIELAFNQAFDRAKRQRSVVGPRAGRLMMRAESTEILHRICLHGRAVFEFHRHTERIANGRAPKSAENAFTPSCTHFSA